LLKILSRITEPTEGRAVIYGRVASLLEVGTGFHAELTGRENIYLSGAILGMGRSEINRKFDEIVAFADLEEFIDTPVKHFSSGMYMRLAFAVAAHLEPEILLVDEVLAVGDVGFQRKCLDKMEDVGKSGRTVLFVSHNMAAISNLCGRAILLESGHICMDGRSQDVVQEYANNIRALDTCPIIERVDRKGNGRLKFVDVVLTNVKEEPVNSFMSGQDGVFVLHYNSDENRPLPNVAFAIMFLDMNGNTLFTTWSELTGQTFQELPPHGTISCLIPNIPLVGGRYGFHIWSAVAGQEADYLKHAGFFDVVDADFFSHGKIPLREKHGSLMVPHSWYAS
jgi:lipopolysaccharide transport system ATP-binding protein